MEHSSLHQTETDSGEFRVVTEFAPGIVVRDYIDAIAPKPRDFAGDLKLLGYGLSVAAAEASLETATARHVAAIAATDNAFAALRESAGPLPSRELTVSLVVAGSGALPVTTDDSALVQMLVDHIDMHPHLFIERFLTLERTHAELLDRVNGLCAREVV